MNLADISMGYGMTSGMDSAEEDRQRAEVFDALSHPTRILILKALSQEALGFADLKKRLGIDSSGHLQHHLNKLDKLVKTGEYGKYILSAEGKDALLTMEMVERAATAGSPQKGRNHLVKKDLVWNVIVVALAVMVIVSMLVLALQFALLKNQASTFQSSLNSNNQEITQLTESLTQCETAWGISQAVISATPQSSWYPPLSTIDGKPTKIVLRSSEMGYFYGPDPLPYVEWPRFPLTIDSANGAVLLPDLGWTNPRGNYSLQFSEEYGLKPYLMISATITNYYTQADFENYAALSSMNWVLIEHNYTEVSLIVKLFRQDNSLVQADYLNLTLEQGRMNNLGNKQFSMRNGDIAAVIFYLRPESYDFDHYEFYISSMQPVPIT